MFNLFAANTYSGFCFRVVYYTFVLDVYIYSFMTFMFIISAAFHSLFDQL